MQTMKKLASLLLALAMIFALATTAFADDPTYSITIENKVAGYTYAAYQIFTGKLTDAGENTEGETNAVLSNIQWGDGVTYTGEGVTVEGTKSKDAADIAAALANKTLTLPDLVNTLSLNAAVATTNTLNDNGEYIISGLAAGYYLVKNTVVPDGGTYTQYIVEVVENSTVQPKINAPEFKKKVKDTNDSTGNTTEWQDSADYDIGDAVPFQLTATLPNNLTSYGSYKVVFHDNLSAGLTFNANSVVVKVDETTLDSSKYQVNTTHIDGTFDIVIDDVKVQGINATNSSVITVEYTATLNEGAVIGSVGNPNIAKLEYTNNPYNVNETGNTPLDKVIVFTYKTVVNKVDGNHTALPGAGFTLYKKDKNDDFNPIAVGKDNDEKPIYVLTGDGLTTFAWTGLDDGEYKLEETITPAGYNTIDPILFTITAEHDVNSEDPKLKALNGGNTFTGTVSTGAVEAQVVNNAGAELPETGGMGTTLFYVLGGILFTAAVVLLVTKKRMAK